MKSKYFFRIFNSLLCLALLSFSLTAANCNDILDALGSDDVTGSWEMTDQGGVQYDICNGETVTFSGTQATLKCPEPGSTPVTRVFTTSGGVLTYTETGVSYSYNVSTSSGVTYLTMTGRNSVNRTLEYKKIVPTDSRSAGTDQKSDKQNLSNSSELK